MEQHRRKILKIYEQLAPTRISLQSGSQNTSGDLPPPAEEEVQSSVVMVCQSWTIYEQAKYATPAGWKDVFQQAGPALQLITANLAQYSVWYPAKEDVFAAFHYTPLNSVKVVIVGQDPYPQGQAMGLSFSVKRGAPIPSSLANIFRELKNNYPEFSYRDGDLTKWAKSGVLLLNKCLTVSPGQPNSHEKVGWMGLISVVVRAITETKPNTIFLLWGNDAKQIASLLPEKVRRLTAPHPSGRSANLGFFGCGHFKEVNRMLTSKNRAYLHQLIQHWVLLRPGLQLQGKKWQQMLEDTMFAEVYLELEKISPDPEVKGESEIVQSFKDWLLYTQSEMVDWKL